MWLIVMQSAMPEWCFSMGVPRAIAIAFSESGLVIFIVCMKADLTSKKL